jgi:hypothetical protein
LNVRKRERSEAVTGREDVSEFGHGRELLPDGLDAPRRFALPNALCTGWRHGVLRNYLKCTR